MTTKKDKLLKLLTGLSDFDSGVRDDLNLIGKEMQKVADKLREQAEVKTVEEAKKRIRELKKDLELIVVSFENLKEELDKSKKELSNILNVKTDNLRNAVIELKTANAERAKDLFNEIDLLKQNIKVISERKTQIPDFDSQIRKAEIELKGIIQKLKEESEIQFKDNKNSFQKRLDELNEDIKKLRLIIAGSRGGGNANRQINVNSSVMSTRYTDINFQQFGNVGWTSVDDDDNKRVNIRASILVGDGGGSGITRSVSIISVSSTFASATSTDYVAFPNVGIRITLPTAVGNSNLYVVKNMATSSVQVAAAVGQDIDGSATVLMPTQYETLGFVSNSSVWGVI